MGDEPREQLHFQNEPQIIKVECEVRETHYGPPYLEL